MNHKVTRRLCPQCGRVIDGDYEGVLCPNCDDMELYKKVKAFVAANDVTEREVAEYFGITVQKVKDWVSRGYMTYKGRE